MGRSPHEQVSSPGAIDQTAAVQAILRSPYQHTLGSPVTVAGIGLHTGHPVTVTLHPAPPDTGRYFLRTDVPQAPVKIPANLTALGQTILSTELKSGEVAVRTVEHLLAALVGLGLDNVCIEVNGPELPLLDGSAQPWIEHLWGNWEPQSQRRAIATLRCPVWVQQAEAFVLALPAPQTCLTYGIQFANQTIGCQWQSIYLADFTTQIAPARTFALAADIEKLRERGLIKGGSLENALVCDAEGWLNPPLRFTNEPVRHKLLDLVGDLSLLGTIPQARFFAYRASHSLHTQLAQRLAQHLVFSPVG